MQEVFVAGETKELRCENVPVALLQAIDALGLALGMSRREYVIAKMGEVVRNECHKVSIQHAMLRGNPLYPEPGTGSEA